jgi:zinc protease
MIAATPPPGHAGPAPVDRTRPPAAGSLRTFHFPPFLHVRLANGLEVYTVRHGDVPLVSLELVTPGGGQFDPPVRSGLATLTAGLLDEGTRRGSALEIAARAERLGGYVSTGADWDGAHVSAGMLAENLEAGFELLAEVATAPTFPPEELERLRRRRQAEILRRRHDPAILADERLAAEVFRGTPYGRSLLGDEESVAAIGRGDVVAYYERHYTLRGAALVAVGDLDPEALVALVEEVLGGAAGAEPPAPPEIHAPPLGGVAVHVVDRPGAAQTELRLGHAGVARRHPDYSPLVVLNTLLGGNFTSRVNLNLRERHGYTYSASSRFVGRQGPGPFIVSAAVATEVTGAAAREVLWELERLQSEAVTPEELEETRSYLIGVFPYTVQTIDDLANRLELLAVYGLPDDYFETYVERVRSVTAEEVLALARRHLHPDRLVVVAVGPAESLEPQLVGLGPVTVWSPEARVPV